MPENFLTAPYNHITINKINNSSIIQFYYAVLPAHIDFRYFQKEEILSLEQKIHTRQNWSEVL